LCLTAGIDPLDVNDKSLRISSSSAWFAAHPAIDPLTRWLDEFGTRIAGDPLWSESDRAALSDEELMALQAIGYAK
jgi:hypothetical protein